MSKLDIFTKIFKREAYLSKLMNIIVMSKNRNNNKSHNQVPPHNSNNKAQRCNKEK